MSSDVIVAFVAVIGLLVGAVNVIATYRVTRNSQSSSLYRETAQAWQAKSESQDSELEDLHKEIALKEASIADLEQRNAVLRDLATNKDLITVNQVATMAKLEELTTEVASLRTLIQGGGIR